MAKKAKPAAAAEAAPVKAAPAKSTKAAATKSKAPAKPKAAEFQITLYDESVIKAEEDRNGTNIGVTTGLRFTHYVNQLLYNNYDSQLSDEELEHNILAEFPNRESIQDMGRYRACFNAGSAGFGVPDAEGKPQKLPKENRLPRYGTESAAPAE